MKESKLNPKLFILFVLAGVLLFPLPDVLGLTAEDVEKDAQQAVLIRQEIQQTEDQWRTRETSLREEMERLEWETKHLSWKRNKTVGYLETMSEKRQNLEKELAGYDRLHESLEPLLDKVFLALEAIVQQDVPFLQQERKAALASLKRKLDDYEITLIEKTGSLFEVLRTEAEYGYKPSVEEAELEIEGWISRGYRFNVGRLALFALDRDSRRAWQWDPGTSSYQPADQYSRQIGQAIEMSNKTRIFDLVGLPVIRSTGRLDSEAEGFTDIHTNTDRP
ncbi:MAG: DUF3450 domain-containing protein [Pseudomonadota bacterium]